MITQGKHTYMGSFDERFNPEVEIGNFSSIGSGVHFYGSCQHPMTVSTYPFADKGWADGSVYPKTFSRGKIVIGNDVWIGEDVKILDGVMIGDGAIIGAGAVVSKNIPAYSVAVGNPIKVVKTRFSKELIKKLLHIQWWNKSDDDIHYLLPYMQDIEEFIRRAR